MRLTRPRPAAFWHSGGALMAAGGPMTPARGLELFYFHSREGLKCIAAGDGAGARYCAELAVELALALCAADDWRCAAAGISRSKSPLADLRNYINHIPQPVEWLRKA